MNEPDLSPAFTRTLDAAGILVVAWGMLLMLTMGMTATGIGSSSVCAACGVAVIQADRRAVYLAWTATVLMAATAVAHDYAPVLVLVTSWFFVLATFLTDSRERLCRAPRTPWRVTAQSK